MTCGKRPEGRSEWWRPCLVFAIISSVLWTVEHLPVDMTSWREAGMYVHTHVCSSSFAYRYPEQGFSGFSKLTTTLSTSFKHAVVPPSFYFCTYRVNYKDYSTFIRALGEGTTHTESGSFHSK